MIVAIIMAKSDRVIVSKISLIATADPVLVLPMTNNVIKLRPITIVFIPPRRTRNPFLLWVKNSEPITAA